MTRILTIVGLTTIIGTAAHAADGGAGAAGLNIAIDGILGAVGVVVGGLAVRLIHRALGYLGLAEDARVRQYLEQATVSAIDYAVRQAGAGTRGAVRDMQHQVIDMAVNYLQRRVPDALSRFDLVDVDLRDYVAARLGRAVDG
ncbi:hypothetical protein P7L78_26520 [Tistrella bauzanensis]|uniref:hypothetical protein n=1 Tax=Tistrella TaxID=171436 RepID=UPI0031F69608